MSAFILERLHAREILDSRGRPTVWAECRLSSGATGAASTPSGASTGRAEAMELRDGDLNRYGGLGCRKSVQNIRGQLHEAMRGHSFSSQAEFDAKMIDLDGTPTLSRLGANATVAASVAFARACAAQRGVPLYRHFAEIAGLPLRSLPQLTVNLFSGGKHAGEQAPLQDILLVPTGAKNVDEGLEAVVSVYRAATKLIWKKYQQRLLRADEGGLSPLFPDAESMLSDAVEAIIATRRTPGADMSMALDAASSHFYRDGNYQLGPERLSPSAMIDRVEAWTRRYPLVSVEDGLSEDDWAHWPMLRQKLQDHCLTLGDDFLCTQPERIRRAIAAKAADALLLKVNQVGTLTAANEAASLARSAGWKVTVSARSGETEDDWLADLAVGWSSDFIKIGSITQSERLAKYNRLLAIEAETSLPIRRS
ncbi:MAG: Enolase [Verrucomicrobia bacterium]|nr:Enolase [Verrucomicrobiota bacterium]